MKSLIRRCFSLRVSILLIVLLCWLAPTVLLGSYLGTRFFDAMRQKTELSLTTSAEQARLRLTENIGAVVTLAKDVVYDGELASALSDYRAEKISYEEYFARCRSYLERKYGREKLIDFALFFRLQNPNGVFFTTDDYESAMYFQLNVLKGVLAMSDELDTGCRFFTHEGQMYLARNLFNTKMEKYGMLVLGLNQSALLSPANEAARTMNVDYAVRLDQSVLYGGDNASDEGERLRNLEGAPEGMSEKGDVLLYTLDASTRDYDVRYQICADKREVYREMTTFRTIMIWMFVLLVPLCVIIMTFVNRRIVRPISLLSDASMRIRGGELGVTVPMHGTDELGQLGSAFSAMSVQLKELVDKSYKEEIALRDARIQAMQSRINSHFLNNALETINWQARMEGSETISTMVEALSCLLNASMDRNERHLVPLREELVVADAYFYFISLRFGEKLYIQKDIAQGLGDMLVPRLAIQTLVENAIEHGIAPMGGGRIGLNVFENDDRLSVEVVNNGNRLTEEDLSRIRRLMSDESDPEGHMGIRNVARRLKLLYGDRARMTIAADERGQTVATFTIPAMRSDSTTNDNKPQPDTTPSHDKSGAKR